MARLSVRLLGPLQVILDGELVTGFESDKVRALLAYLVFGTERPHRREKLAGLLWPDWPERSARTNLRRALANLRQVISDHQATLPFLHISRQTIQFNSASDAWIDVAAFTDLLQAKGLSQQTIHRLEQAVELYRGDFLEGFSVGDSPAFEEWVLLNRERLRRLVIEAFHRLAECHEQYGEYERGLEHAWRQVELDPWRENAHRQLMRLLALSDQRGAALAQYETCRRLLAEELGVEPAAETTRLYEQIRDGKLKAPVPSPAPPPDVAAKPPPFLDEEEPVEVERPVFVARERELGQLGRFLDLALAGQGRVAFVTGEAGSGKTALVQEFTRRAQDAYPDLVVASGNCSAYTGIGDPYLPFREVLGLLTGDVEARWAAGAMTREHACRLWNTLPLAAQALVEAGRDLMDTFVPGTALVGRATAFAPGGADWLTRLDELVERKPTGAGVPGPQQSDLFEQYTRVLQTLARQAPLVLVLDDLQWADAGSISLLFHLGRQLAGSHILIVGAYRSEEVALGRDGERHTLEPVVNEFQRDFGDITVDLGQAESRDFIEAFLDSEPNRLGVAFREMLYRQTRGHPLFTIELLRGLQERGDLVQDPEGRWVEGPALDWETLPARVEAVIAERIGRLAQPLQGALRVASVEGEVFTAEVVARVRATDEREMVGHLSGELDRRHRLIRAQGILRMDGQRLSRYRFRHILFQRYLYSSLDQVERAHLHEDLGNVLEALYGGQTEEVAVQLARHFQEAGISEKAVAYLHQAGDRAVRLSANEEAIAHFTRGLELLKTLPDSSERAQQELNFQLALAAPHQAARGYAAPETGRAYARAYELCQQMDETPQLLPALWSLGSFYLARAEHQKSLRLTEQILNLAQRMEDPLQVAMARWGLGVEWLHVGELVPARGHLEQVIAFYDPQQHGSLAFTFGQDPGVSALAWAAWTLWFLGYPDQALERSQEALALARELDHPFTLGFALNIAGSFFHQLRREGQMAKERNEAMMQLSTEEGFPLFQVLGTTFQGWTQAMAGQVEAARPGLVEGACPELVEGGIAQMRQGLATWQAMGAGMQRPHLLALLAEAYGSAGQAEEGLNVLAEALTFVQSSDERYYEAELYRLKGELLLIQGDEAEAEASFDKAIEVARRQQAKSWELRATVSLCRLWQKQGRVDEARQMLAEIYTWFTEGFDTPDLQEAKALLEELSRNQLS
jgi:DNA-binding SARP family transcriptional activator/predicted ATPase